MHITHRLCCFKTLDYLQCKYARHVLKFQFHTYFNFSGTQRSLILSEDSKVFMLYYITTFKDMALIIVDKQLIPSYLKFLVGD